MITTSAFEALPHASNSISTAPVPLTVSTVPPQESVNCMKDLNDLYYFVQVVKHGGFSAAARATGIEKTLLSRRVAHLELRVGARLLHRTTRQVSLTEAGHHFFTLSQPVVEGAHTAYESVEHLRREP